MVDDFYNWIKIFIFIKKLFTGEGSPHDVMTKMLACSLEVVIYKAFCLDVAQGHINEASNETLTHSWRFASLAC